MTELSSILESYYPAGADINHHLAGMLDNHLEDILADLPRIGSLPMPGDLGELEAESELCPLVIEETITVASLKRHLSAASPETPEISITIFQKGTQMLEIGTVERVLSSSASEALQDRGVIDLHTHPGPTKTEHMRQPSISDITNTIIRGWSTAIGSHDGLTHVPNPGLDLADRTGFTLWRDYVANRGFDEPGFKAYGPSKIYAEFVREIIKPQFTPWDILNDKSSLADAGILKRES
jgi:hypothetical protein